MTVIERGLTESSGDTAHAKCGRAETVKSNIDRFHSFPKPQVAGPIPAEGASVSVNLGTPSHDYLVSS